MDMLISVGILKPLLLVQDMDMGIELLMLMLLPVAIQLALQLLLGTEAHLKEGRLALVLPAWKEREDY
jgi:hypothetical protein